MTRAMARGFRYPFEPARSAALARERAAGLAYARARDAESRCFVTQPVTGLGAPAALFAVNAAAATEARLRVVDARAALDEALDRFPELAASLHQPAGALSGGEQQMLALARVMMTAPKLLMIDELALGRAPMAVNRLMAIVREVNAEGTTVILVEQSVNRAMSLAERAVFLERGEVRFDGPTG